MKKIFPCIFLFFISGKLYPQYLDSLRQALTTHDYDSSRVFTFLWLSDYYGDNDRDSAMYYAQGALKLAVNINFKKGEAQSLNIIGSILTGTGNYPKAFEYHLEALKIAEKQENPVLVAAIYNNLARVSTERSDYQTALDYLFKSKTVFEQLDRQHYVATSLLNIGDAYDRMGKHDSAINFLSQARELAIRIDYSYLLGAVNSNLGHVYTTIDKPETAAAYFRQSIEQLSLSDDKNDQETLAGVYEGLSKVMEAREKKDSALFFARQSFGISMKVADQKRILNAAKRLNELYDKESLIDSAYRYSNIANETRESILSEQKIMQLESMKFNEQLRQQEIAKKEAEARKERTNNLRLIGIVLFIITFFAILIIVSRRRAHPRALKYLGMLGLLLLFEFIALFIHPYIDKWTGHHPVYMLIILVTVAAVLVPLHHKMEHWVKEKLANEYLRDLAKKGVSNSKKTEEKIKPGPAKVSADVVAEKNKENKK
jgi:tetratricopeptide (TPR) repeat protein